MSDDVAADFAEVMRAEYLLYESRRSSLGRGSGAWAVVRGVRSVLAGREARARRDAIPATDALFLALESRQDHTLAPARALLAARGISTAAITSGPARGDLRSASDLAIDPRGRTRTRDLLRASEAAAAALEASPHRRTRAANWLRSDAPRQARWSAIAAAALASARPRLLVGADDVDSRARWFFRLAEREGIPTLRVQFGLSADTSEWLPGIARWKAVHGPRMRRLLVSGGIPTERIIEVGQPRFAGLAELPLPKDRSVLFVSQPFVEGAFASEAARRELLRSAGAALASVAGSGTRIGIRPHPDESSAVLAAELERGGLRPGTYTTHSETSAREALLRHDAVVGMFSALLIEALLARRTVVRVGMSGTSPIARDFDAMLPPLPFGDVRTALTAPRVATADMPAVRRWLRDEFDDLPNDGAALADAVASLLRADS